jgi:hypothetical protein
MSPDTRPLNTSVSRIPIVAAADPAEKYPERPQGERQHADERRDPTEDVAGNEFRHYGDPQDGAIDQQPDLVRHFEVNTYGVFYCGLAAVAR